MLVSRTQDTIKCKPELSILCGGVLPKMMSLGRVTTPVTANANINTHIRRSMVTVIKAVSN